MAIARHRPPLPAARWRADPTEDRWGSFVFLRDTASNEWWSATAEPRSIANEHVRVSFSDDKAEFTKTVGDLTSEMEVFVASNHDAEGRRLTISNTGTEDRVIEVTSYMEPVATLDAVDTGHPVFARMFLKTEIAANGDAIFVERQKRGVGFQPGLVDTLRRRELEAVAERIAAETGRPQVKPESGEYVTGTYQRRLNLASGRFAMIDDGLGFSLVPWTPSLEKQLGRHVSGVARGEGGVDWSFSRQRGLGL